MTVLLDTGSDSIFVARRLVKPSAITSSTIPVRTAAGVVPDCPVAKACFSCPYYPGGLSAVILLDDPPYDVLLGEVPGTHKFSEPPPPPPVPELPEDRVPTSSGDAEGIAAVTTRSQHRLNEARARNPEAPNLGPVSPLLQVDRTRLAALQRDCSSLSTAHERARDGREIAMAKGIGTYFYKEGLLYQRLLQEGETSERLVIPRDLREELLKVAHENPFSGHFSTMKTATRLQRDFYWPRLTDDVRNHCTSCTICQTTTNKRPAKASLGTPGIATEPFAHVCIDLIGPLKPVSSEGHRWILTLVDQATRYPDAVPLRHIDSATVSQALLGMFSHFGFPQTLTSDNGAQFTSEMFAEFLGQLGTEHQRTPPYHAQSNGLVERFNGTLKQILRKLCAERPKDWHRQIPAVLFAYRDANHAATGFSPFELVFGHRVRGPLTVVKEALLASTSLADDPPPDEETTRALARRVIDMKDKLRETCRLARQGLQEAQGKHKFYFDKKSRDRVLQEEDKVLIFLPTEASKLTMTWKGPGIVRKRIDRTIYEVELNKRTTRYHINHLRKFEERERHQPPAADGEETPPTLTTPKPADGAFDEVTEAFAAVAIAVEDPAEPAYSTLDPCVPDGSSLAAECPILNPNLGPDRVEALEALTDAYQEVFSNTPGLTQTLSHHIKLRDDYAVRLQHSYPIPLALESTLRTELDKWLELGVVEPSRSPYCSPLLAVRKKDGTHRFCLDCRQLNAQTVFDGEPIADPQKIFAEIAQARYFSKLDLTSGYWQVPMNEDSKPLTAFRTRFGLYQFTVMPFGLVNAPATFSRLMREVTADLNHTHCYLDDLLVATSTWEEHLEALEALLKALRRHGLKAKPSKCELGLQELTYLGHRVGGGTYTPLPDRVEAIANLPLPRTQKQLRSFLGSVGYYDQFVPRYADLRGPLDKLLTKGSPDVIAWDPQTIKSFETLRDVLLKDPVLQLPDGELPYTLQTDASDTGLGAALLQPCLRDPRKLAPVAFASRTLKGPERNYSTVEKEALAIFWALQKFHIHLYGREFRLRTDHRPLLYLGQSDRLNPRLKRWALLIGLYRFKSEYIPGAENHLPDLLSRIDP